MTWRVSVVTCVLVMACGRLSTKAAPVAVDAQAAAPSPSAASPEDAATHRVDAGGVDLAPYTMARPVSGKSVGHTSVVFKLKLEGGVEAAYKPRSRRGKTRYRGEVAAYRLGRALGIPNVPPAIVRSFSVDELRAALGDPSSGAGKLFADEIVPDEHGEVRGALIPWIVGLTFPSLEAEPKRTEWRAWLGGPNVVPEDERDFAAQISDLLIFDYLTGNWDRWSGGNIGADESGQKLLFIDNDGAFFDPPPPEPLAKQRALVREDARFSKGFIRALRALDPEVAKAAMGEDAPGEPLLAPKVLAGLEERRKEVLGLVDARIAKDGEDKVLTFE